MYIKKTRKIYDIASARANLSSIIRDAPIEPAFIGKYGEVTAVLVDSDVAEKYLPKEYMRGKEQLGGVAMYQYAQKKLKQLEKRKKPIEVDNLSSRVDEILYGTKPTR